MLRLLNVATPWFAVPVFVPDSVPPPGFTAIDTVTFPVKDVTVFPAASSAVTCTGGVSVCPAVSVVGCCVNTSWVTEPMRMSNGSLTVPVIPLDLAESVYPLPAWSILRSEKVATPPTSGTVFVPARLAPAVPVPVVIDSVTLPMTPVAGVPDTAPGGKEVGRGDEAPAMEVVGCAVNSSRNAAPGSILKDVLTVSGSPSVDAVNV